MTHRTFNRLVFFIGLIGFPISVHASEGRYGIIGLCGIGLFGYFIVSSIVDSLQRRRK